MTQEELRRRLAEMGLHPSEAALAEIHAALPHLRAMQARLRRGFDRSDEPAHVFRADAFGADTFGKGA